MGVLARLRSYRLPNFLLKSPLSIFSIQITNNRKEFDMLNITRRNGESIFIFPSDSLPAEMTVAELFKDGAIEICLFRSNTRQAKIGVKAPEEMVILRDDLIDNDKGVL